MNSYMILNVFLGILLYKVVMATLILILKFILKKLIIRDITNRLKIR